MEELANPLLEDEDDGSYRCDTDDEDDDEDDHDHLVSSRVGRTLRPYLNEVSHPAAGTCAHGRTRSLSAPHFATSTEAALKAAGLKDAAPLARNHYTPIAATVFTINYIVGVGSLGIPNAFLQGGSVLGVATVAVSALVTYVTINWICETVVRAAKLALLPCEAHRKGWQCTKAHAHDPTCFSSESRAHAAAAAATAGPATRSEDATPTTMDALEAGFPPSTEAVEATTEHSERLEGAKPAVGAGKAETPIASPAAGGKDDELASAADLEDSYEFDDCCDPPPGRRKGENDGKVSSNLKRQILQRTMTPRTTAWKKTRYVDPIDVDWKSFEVVSLCQKFYGEGGKRLYQVALVLLMYTGLLGYAQVFGTSLDAELLQYAPQWGIPSWAIQVAFAAVVIPLSCMELSEQICVQLSMGALNLCILLFMAGCCVFALYGDAVDNLAHNSTANSTNVTTIGTLEGELYPGAGAGIEVVREALRRHLEASWPPFENETAAITATGVSVRGPPHETSFAVPLVDFSGFGLMLSTTVTSLLCQHSVPGLIQPLDKQYTSRGRVACIFGVAIAIVSFLYIALGLSTVYYFGDLVKPSININWEKFRFGVAWDAQLPLGLRVVAAAVVLFPVLNTPIIFPLIAITLGNNLTASMPAWPCIRGLHRRHNRSNTASIEGAVKSAPTSNGTSAVSHPLHPHATSAEGKKKHKRLVRLNRILYRICAAVPPLGLSFLGFDLSVTLQLAGIPAILVALVSPALLQHRSKRTARRQFRHSATKYTWHFSHDAYIYCILVLAAGILGIIIVETIQMFLRPN